MTLDYFTDGEIYEAVTLSMLRWGTLRWWFAADGQGEIKSLLQKRALLRQKSRFHSDNTRRERMDLMSWVRQERKMWKSLMAYERDRANLWKTRIARSLRPPHERGGTKTYRYTRIPRGGRMRSTSNSTISQGVTELGRNFSDVETYAVFEGRLHRAGNKSMQIVIEAC